MDAPVPKLYEVLFTPHILDAVLKELPYESLLALRLVSTVWREPIDPLFLRHVIIDRHPSGNRLRWISKCPLGPIPLKNWHKKQICIDQVEYLDLRREHLPSWAVKIKSLKSLRYAPTFSSAAPLIVNPSSSVTIRKEDIAPNRPFNPRITEGRGHVVVAAGQKFRFMHNLSLLPSTLTIIMLPGAGSAALQEKKDWLLLNWTSEVANLLARVARVKDGSQPLPYHCLRPRKVFPHLAKYRYSR